MTDRLVWFRNGADDRCTMHEIDRQRLHDRESLSGVERALL
jgi:hypothetical protein